MALERPHEREQVERNARLEREARRDYWRDLLRTLAQIVLCVVAGLALMGAALHTTDPAIGRVLWIAGQTVWLSGVMFSLLGAYRRGARRGDW